MNQTVAQKPSSELNLWRILRIVTPLVRTAHKGGERVPAAIGGPKKASNNLVLFKLATIAAFYSETCGAGECFRPKCSGNFQLFSS